MPSNKMISYKRVLTNTHDHNPLECIQILINRNGKNQTNKNNTVHKLAADFARLKDKWGHHCWW